MNLSESTNTFIKFIMDLFLTSEDVSDVFVSKSTEMLYTSESHNEGIILNFIDKCLKNDFPSTITIQGNKFIKLHASPFNIIYRSKQGQKALLGANFPVEREEIQTIALVAQTSMMQLQSTALKDITHSIIEMGQKATEIVTVDPNTLQINVSLPENKQTIDIFIESLKLMHFLCDYKDKGDSVMFNFKYKKVEKQIYSDDVYKQYMK